MKRFSQVYSLYVDLETAFKTLSVPENLLRALGIFDTVTPIDPDTAEVEIAIKLAFGVTRRLKAKFRRLLEPPNKIVLISDGGFVMTITAQLEPRAASETRLVLSIQVSASFFVESALAYRITSVIGSLGVKLQEEILGAAKPAAPAARPAPAAAQANPAAIATPGSAGTIDKYSENMADSLVLSSLLLNSKYLSHVRTSFEGLNKLLEKVGQHSQDRDYLYVVVSPETGGWTLRLLVKDNEVLAAVLEEKNGVTIGREALVKLEEQEGQRLTVKIFEPDPDSVSRILS